MVIKLVATCSEVVLYGALEILKVARFKKCMEVNGDKLEAIEILEVSEREKMDLTTLRSYCTGVKMRLVRVEN